ncbi:MULTISPECIES: DUF2756 domain-containing protein [Sodalis]|jgi:recombinational DNA repair protein (RecF pathway)|uniref:Uncharacterized protein DUF2756 n=1 Tax=Sodalis ligni TaxID=2697027 RepID=A0A4R1NCP5_9GAMM|nr:DUF2756 domain-containing protein [Sodalis ligni]TCL05143.1 uncharacterized protein DUF2756 [Sodalis ligni]
MKLMIWLGLTVALAACAVSAAQKPGVAGQPYPPFTPSPAQQHLQQQMQMNAQQQQTRLQLQQQMQRDQQRSQLQSQLNADRQRTQQNAPANQLQQNP